MWQGIVPLCLNCSTYIAVSIYEFLTSDTVYFSLFFRGKKRFQKNPTLPVPSFALTAFKISCYVKFAWERKQSQLLDSFSGSALLW